MRKVMNILAVWVIATMVLSASALQPDWIDNWSRYYPDNHYIGAVGYGKSRSAADEDALSQLAAFFGASVSTHTVVSSSSTSSSVGINTDESSRSTYSSASSITVDLSNMVGTSFRERWDDGRNYYSLAVIDRNKTKEYYFSQANTSAGVIKQAFELNPSEISFVNYHLVRNISENLVKYDEAMRILSVVASPLAYLAEKIPARNEISDLIDRLTYNAGVNVVCDDEAWDYLCDDFLSVLSSHGINIFDDETRYVISVDISIEPTEVPGNTLKFAKYSLTVTVHDQVLNKAIFTWKGSGREGQLSQDAAEDRALIAIRKKFKGDFDQKFSKTFNL